MKILVTITMLVLSTVIAQAATLTKTIGTTSRDYSTIQLWEDDLDDGTSAANDATAYSSGDDAVGEVYNDSVFDESVTLNGGGTVGLNSITLTAPSSERHDGTAGNGARIVRTASGDLFTFANDIVKKIEFIEIDKNGNGNSAILMTGAQNTTISKMIIHDAAGASGGTSPVGIIYGGTGGNPGGTQFILNNFIYDIHATGGSSVSASGLTRTGTNVNIDILNNTILHIESDSTSGPSIGMLEGGTSVIRNNVVADCASGSSSGSEVCYSGTWNTSQTNASDDSTAPDPIAAEPVIAGDEFVSTTGGSEDLHLKSGAESIDAGTDLGTSPSDIEIDINNRDRDALGDVWDLGAHEFVAAAIVTSTINASTLNASTIN